MMNIIEQVNIDQSQNFHVIESPEQSTTILLGQAAPKRDRRLTKEHAENFRLKVKRTTKAKITSGVVDDYKHQLKEPDFEVSPVLLDVDFYRGKNAADEGQYTPESDFSSNKGKWTGRAVSLQKLHSTDIKKRCRHVSLVGGAGSGKTTLMKRYALMAMERKIKLDPFPRKGFFRRLATSFRRRSFDFVHFINVRDLPTGAKKYTPCHLLFECLVDGLKQEEMEAGFEWLIDKNKNALFVIDGLDQYDWTLEAESKKVGYHEEASVACVMYNLLCGNLFPNAWVLTSSREHKILYFANELRADKIVALNDLEEDDIEKLVKALPRNPKHEIDDIWSSLNTRCPNVLRMCTTPLFLIFALLVFIQKKGFAPETMAGVMVELINGLIQSKHATNPNLKEIIDKLKKLAYVGTLDKRVIFKDADIKSVGLQPGDAKNLMIFSPKETQIIIRQKLMDDEYVMFFCHQSIQETFSAMYIADMELDQFREFLSEHVHSPHFSVIRRLLCGLLLNENNSESTGKLLKDRLLQYKRDILKESMKLEMERMVSQNSQNSQEQKNTLELFSALYECGSGADDIIGQTVRGISLNRMPLTVAEMNVIAMIASRSLKFSSLDMWDCDLNREKMKLLWDKIQHSHLKIERMDIHSNYKADIDCCQLGKIVQHCEVQVVDINDCNLDDVKMKEFDQSLHNSKIKTFNIGKNPRLGPIGTRMIGGIVKECGVKSLTIDGCKLTTKKIKNLQLALGQSQVEVLDINYNRIMGTHGIRHMGEIVRDCKVEHLNMSWCNLSRNEISSFGSSLGTAKMRILDITTHRLHRFAKLSDARAILRLLPHVTEELRMLDWEIPEDVQSFLQKHLNGSARTSCKIIYSEYGNKCLKSESEEL